jgi:hypothetical protein
MLTSQKEEERDGSDRDCCNTTNDTTRDGTHI